jgi:hypothetical protein
LEIGYLTLRVRFTQIRVAFKLKVIKTAWKMEDLIQGTSTGGGIHGAAVSPGLILRNFFA